MRLRAPLLLVAIALAVAACGDDEPADNAVEAREGNTAEIGGLGYRAVLFRELNPRIPPDQTLVEGTPTGQQAGLYAAFVRVCNESGERRRPTDRIRLEDAFGERFPPLESVDPALAYSADPLEPGECMPAPDSAAAATFDGAPIVFEVPFDSAQERPLILEIAPRDGGDPVRIQLDL